MPLTVWLTGNKLPLASVALALEKTPPPSSPISTKRRGTRWSLLSWLSFLRPPGKAMKQPDGIPPLPNVFGALTGRPKRRKLRCVWADKLLPQVSHPPAISSFRLLSFPLLSPVCPLRKPQRHLKPLLYQPLKFQVVTFQKRHAGPHAAVAAAVDAIAANPNPARLPNHQRFRLRPLRNFPRASRLLPR